MTEPTTDQAVIAPAGLVFADLLAELHGACFAETGGETWDARAFSDLLAMPGARAWTATAEDGAPAGFVLSRLAADEVEIITIGVVPAARRRGIARDLLARALAKAADEGAATAHLEVADDNTSARRFYRALGFAETGRRPGYYKRDTGRVDAVVMSKRL
jgi:ribosomal-protein-alanine N-acetyltransferase